MSIKEYDPNPMKPGGDSSSDQEGPLKSKRGRKAIPQQWTRVISLSTDSLEDLKLYPLATDLMLEEGYDKTRKRKGEPDWEIHFCPKEFMAYHPEPTRDKWQLNEDRMRRYGEQITKIRGWVIERALAEDQSLADNFHKELSEVSKLAQKMAFVRRRKELAQNPVFPQDFIIRVPPLLNRKAKKTPKLTVTNKISIAYKVLVEHNKQTDVAREFRVSQP